MSSFNSLIDPAEFGLIADYLRSPQSPLFFLLHVRSKAALAPLAEALSNQSDEPPWLYPTVVERGLADGSLRLSARHRASDSEGTIDARSVPRQALCHVIYSPPFYLVHTPGLFEGTLIRPNAGQNLDHELHQKPATRRKV